MSILSGFLFAIFLSILSSPLVKVYQLENYKPKNFLKRVFKFNIAFGDKNKINFTNRLKRFLFCDFLLIFVLFFLVFYFTENIYINIAMIFVGIIFLPLFMVISHFLCLPIEKLVMDFYIKKATKKLSLMPCKKIAITGSFGKTTTKNILLQILSQKYKVCATPKSYNTPMGVCKTILENLTEKDDFFIVEMGARHKGDIAFLCKLVGVDYGILTPVGKCHIETFKSLDNVEKTKFELCENVKNFVVINGKSDSNLKLYENCEKKKYLICTNESFAYASGVQVKDLKTFFTLHIDKTKIEVSTSLFGKSNVDNIVVASALAYLLGVNILDIKKGIESLKPIPHRLELIKGFAYVLDDSYNSNFSGFKQALEVLSNFKGKKILVTPGMVELGSEQFELNFQIAKNMAKVCDEIVVMNKVNREAILKGLREEKFDEKRIHLATSRKEQTEILKKIITKDSVVLFENDLPDNYK